MDKTYILVFSNYSVLQTLEQILFSTMNTWYTQYTSCCLYRSTDTFSRNFRTFHLYPFILHSVYCSNSSYNVRYVLDTSHERYRKHELYFVEQLSSNFLYTHSAKEFLKNFAVPLIVSQNYFFLALSNYKRYTLQATAKKTLAHFKCRLWNVNTIVIEYI